MSITEVLCPDCNNDQWLVVDDIRVCMHCGGAMELSEIAFDCPCGCDGDASICSYAETCPDCGSRYYATFGHKCDEQKQSSAPRRPKAK